MSLSANHNIKSASKNEKEKKCFTNQNPTILDYFQSSTKSSSLNNLNKNNIIKPPKKIFFTTTKEIFSQKEILNTNSNNNNILNNKPKYKFEVINTDDVNNDIKLEGELDKNEKLLLFFKGKKIYIEIYNGQENSSEVFYDILLQYKIIQCKRLSKNIDYIIFKEGHLKTKKYAVMNNIKMVNPLWVDDKINRNIFKDDKEYLVEASIGDIMLMEKSGLTQDTAVKNYDNELEAEFDRDYANMIDKQREKNKKKKNEENETKQKNIIREKRRTKNKHEVTFMSESENDKDKNMVIEDFINIKSDENDENNLTINDESIEIKETKKEEKIIKKKIFKVHTDLNYLKNNNNNISKTNNLINKNGPVTRSRTPVKTKLKMKKKIKSKDYKHKATSKKIMVTNISQKGEQNKAPLSSEKNNKFQTKIQKNNDINNTINKENQNNNTNISHHKNDKGLELIDLRSDSDTNQEEVVSKDYSNISLDPKEATLGQKINIITYKLEEKEIQCLASMSKFEYKGDLKNPLVDYGSLYSSASVIILDKERSKYDLKMYDFFMDKKILVDFASFLFEFMTEKIDEDVIDAKNTLDKLNKISINEETYFLNKKIRYQRRSLLHTYNIVENISDHKRDREDKMNDSQLFNFVINKDIMGGEKRILHKLIKMYLKANIIKIDFNPKRSHSVGPGMKYRFKIENKSKINEIINKCKKDIFLINKVYEKRNKMDISDDKSIDDESKDDDNEKSEEKKEVKGDTYLISKEKVSSRGFLKKIPNFKEIISYKYILDSFWAGKLLNLNDESILKKYQF